MHVRFASAREDGSNCLQLWQVRSRELGWAGSFIRRVRLARARRVHLWARREEDTARALFDSYDSFLGVLDDADQREHLISASIPGGGSSDYVVFMYIDGARKGAYEAFCRPDTRIPLMYPAVLDDTNARRDWGWGNRYDLPAMTQELLPQIRELLATRADALGPSP
jgi:hypothetical protein